MSCKSCKNKDENPLNVFKRNVDGEEVEPTPKDLGFQIFNILIRTIMFVVGLLITPLIMLFVVYLLFKTIVLNRSEINIMPSLLAIAKTLGIGKKKVEEEHPEDYEDLDVNNPDEYELSEKVDKI